MNRKRLLIAVCVASMVAPMGLTMGQESDDTAPKTLASTISVYVFPKAGQVATQQSQDEAGCYTWAVQNTGTDPFELAKKAQEQQAKAEQQKAQAKQAGQGAAAAGAVKGAVKGALIGEIISDDAGEGAAWGAAAGIARGRRQRRSAKRGAEEKAEQAAQQSAAATQEQMTNFKKAFSVCLEAKDYLVKY